MGLRLTEQSLKVLKLFLDDPRASADTIARTSGRTLGDLSYASVDTFENPRIVASRMARPMAAMAQAAQAPTEEFTPQSVTVTAHVNALFNLK